MNRLNMVAKEKTKQAYEGMLKNNADLKAEQISVNNDFHHNFLENFSNNFQNSNGKKRKALPVSAVQN